MRMARACTPLLESTHRCTLTSAAASGVSPLPFQMHTPSPHLRRDRAPATSAPGPGSPCHIRTGTGLTPATSAPGPGSPPCPHLARALACWLAHATPCAVTGPAQHGPTWPEHVRLVLAAQQAHAQAQQLCAAAEAAACRADREPPGLGLPLLPHLHRDRAHPAATSASASGRGVSLPHLHRDWAHSTHICAGTGHTRSTSAPGRGSSLSHLHGDSARLLHYLCDDAIKGCSMALSTRYSWLPY